MLSSYLVKQVNKKNNNSAFKIEQRIKKFILCPDFIIYIHYFLCKGKHLQMYL